MSKIKNLHFRWTISRARDSYGYNICTLLVDGQVKGRCNGGNYDMQGTSLGHWLERDFQDRLLKLKTSFYGLTFHDPNFDPGKVVLPSGKTVEQAEKDGDSLGLDRYQQFYHASSKVPTEKHVIATIDGACGFGSVEKIANAIGIRLQWNPESNRSRNHNYYTAMIDEMPEPKKEVLHGSEAP